MIEGQTDRHIDRQTDRQTEKQRRRYEREREREKERGKERELLLEDIYFVYFLPPATVAVGRKSTKPTATILVVAVEERTQGKDI